MIKKLLISLLFALVATAIMSISAMACGEPNCTHASMPVGAITITSFAIFEDEAAYRLVEHKLDEILEPYRESEANVQVLVTEMADGSLVVTTQPMERYFSILTFCFFGNPASVWGVMTAITPDPPPRFINGWELFRGCRYDGTLHFERYIRFLPCGLHVESRFSGTMWHSRCYGLWR